MGKEAVVLVVDVGPSMCAPLQAAAAKASTRSRLSVATEAVRSLVGSLMLKGKTAEVAVVCFGAPETNNPLNYMSIDVVHPMARPGVELLAMLTDDEERREKGQAVPGEDAEDRPEVDEAEQEMEGDGQEEGTVPLAVKRYAKMVGDFPRGLPRGASGSQVDFVEAMIVAVDELVRKIGKKKFDKKIVLLTDACSRVQGIQDLVPVVSSMQSMDISLQVIGLDFVPMGGTAATAANAATAAAAAVSGATAASDQLETQRLLLSLVNTLDGEFISATNLLEMVHALLCVTKTPQMRNIDFQLSPDVSFPAKFFARTQPNPPPSLKKVSATHHDPRDLDSGKVQMDRVYRNPDNQQEEVAVEDQLRGHRYGADILPIDEDDAESFKIPGEPSMVVLGFMEAERVPRSFFLGNVVVVFGAHEASASAIATLATAMRETNHVAVVRFTKMRDRAPTMGVLIPDMSPEAVAVDEQLAANAQAAGGAADAAEAFLPSHRLLFQQLPFAEDLRDFVFPSFKNAPASRRPTDAQQAAMSAFVDSMTVGTNAMSSSSSSADADADADDMPVGKPGRSGVHAEILDPRTIMNPSRQRGNQLIIDRAVDPMVSLPAPSEAVQSVVLPDEKLLARARADAQRVADSFTFTRVENKKKNKRRMWASLALDLDGDEDGLDAAGGEGGGGADAAVAAGAAAAAAAAASASGTIGGGCLASEDSLPGAGEYKSGEAPAGKRARTEDALGREQTAMAVGSIDPVKDFKAMLASDDDSVVARAVEQMQKRVTELVEGATMQARYTKALTALQALRAGCIEEGHGAEFNSYMRQTIKARGLGGGAGTGAPGTAARFRKFWSLVRDNSVALISSDDDSAVPTSPEEAQRFLTDEDMPVVSAPEPVAPAADDDEADLFDALA